MFLQSGKFIIAYVTFIEFKQWNVVVRASFLFVGDLNGHHQEQWGSTTTTCHGVFDFATVSGCDQLVVGPTHARGGTLDLLMTNVPELVRIAVVAPIGNSDHSSLSAVIDRKSTRLNSSHSAKSRMPSSA